MSTPFLSEIRIVAFNFPPKGWAFCNGQLLSIQQNQALFALVGTIYGGNGTTNFGLPDLRGRVPVHMGTGFSLGQVAGEVSHTLITNEIPLHQHTYTASADAATTSNPTGARPATAVAAIGNAYAPGPAGTAFAPKSIGPNSGNQPHTNMQPYLTLTFVIAMQGIFPSRN
jgi:microcystin-dependent protein